jgi:hypothetical protein
VRIVLEMIDERSFHGSLFAKLDNA